MSTGLPGRFDHFETPLGVFDHVVDDPDFRAEGTRNELGIRRYGRKGARIYDFGWVLARKGWGDRGKMAIAQGRHFWVLPADRSPTPWSGRYVVVVDSRESPPELPVLPTQP